MTPLFSKFLCPRFIKIPRLVVADARHSAGAGALSQCYVLGFPLSRQPLAVCVSLLHMVLPHNLDWSRSHLLRDAYQPMHLHRPQRRQQPNGQVASSPQLLRAAALPPRQQHEGSKAAARSAYRTTRTGSATARHGSRCMLRCYALGFPVRCRYTDTWPRCDCGLPTSVAGCPHQIGSCCTLLSLCMVV